jgi:hypothetical protein
MGKVMFVVEINCLLREHLVAYVERDKQGHVKGVLNIWLLVMGKLKNN